MTTPRAEVLAAVDERLRSLATLVDVATRNYGDGPLHDPYHEGIRFAVVQLRDVLDAALAAQEGDQGEAVESTPLGDHPHVDPRDGRTECYLCGKFVHDVTHSCKGVPVTRAAEARVRALIDAVRADAAAPDAGDAVRAVAAVKALADEWEDEGTGLGAAGLLVDLARELRAALADTTGALAKVKAEALRDAANDYPLRDAGGRTEAPGGARHWLRERADRIEARGGRPMSERVMVSEAELKRLWFSDDATGMIHDHQQGHKVVVMADGTEYATPFADLEADR